MRKKITAVFNRFEISLTMEDARSASHQGQCDEDVAALLKEPYVVQQFASIDPDAIRKELAEYSDWDVTNDEDNRARILWIAAGNITEGNL